MKLTCDYCGNFISDTDEKCPFCGAPNNHLAASAKGVPKTIEELLAFCNAHKIPYEKMRFFIGKDCKEPRAFGIYKDSRSNNFVVYKNKSDGSRAIRYQGKDEAYAVNEIYQKMRSELSERKEAHPENIKKNSSFTPRKKKNKGNIFVKIAIAVVTIFILILVIGFVLLMFEPSTGYYTYQGNQYYKTSDDWYVYDDGWIPFTADDTFTDNIKDYWNGTDYDDSYNADSFENSPYYEEPSSSSYSDDDDDGYWDDDDSYWDDDDWDDDDWDYDYDSWDSYDTDWDSDW